MDARTRRATTTDVAIVSMNPETLDGLQAYLSAAGVAARCMREIDDCARGGSDGTLAFVLFPDDFAWERVAIAVGELVAKRPRALPVLVTAHPKRYEKLLEAEKVLIVARPAWGWSILDAIRAHLDAGRSGTPDAEVVT